DFDKIKSRISALPKETQDDAGILIDTHAAMLRGSRLIRGVEKRIQQDMINAEQALDLEMRFMIVEFAKITDPYIKARIDDVEAVCNRLLRSLMDLPFMSLDSVPMGGLVFASEISPADTVLLDPQKFGGLATIRGGAAGHTAIMARGLGLPAVLGIPHLIDHIRQGDEAIIDGKQDIVIINPSPETKASYQSMLLQYEAEQADLTGLTALPAETTDGVKMQLRANLEIPRELQAALDSSAEGIGLFRTEFMFMNRPVLPDENEQYEIISKCLDQLDGKPMTIRTLDIGGDKLVQALGNDIQADSNPALGLRAIRLALKKPEILKTQFRAILRAATHGYVRILLPLVTTAEEMEQARSIYEDTIREMKAEGIALPNRTPPLGCMIEVPAAALAADSLAIVSDFFALGTNDLTQYTVAIDRGNDQVADLYDSLNPAVLRMIDFAFQAAKRAGIPISICGEMAADPKLTGLLFGIGLRDFSVGAGALLRIKRRIREMDSTAAITHANEVMSQNNRDVIQELIKRFND
ncbi:MAG: phosphoenolpyruvate--protein phosphotransferase, partial [Pseudomonadota bacterium]